MLPTFFAGVADNALGATVLAVAVFVVTRFWRNPAAQHALWLLVLVKLITPCVVPLPFGGVKFGAVQHTEFSQRSELTSFSVGRTGSTTHRSAAMPAQHEQHPGVESSPAAAEVARTTEHYFGLLLLLAWVASSGAWLTIAALRILRFHRAVGRTAPAPIALQDLAHTVATTLGYTGPLDVRISASPLPPLLWCVGRPKIVFPQHLDSTLGTDALRGILAHEISHLLRRDHWTRWLELAVFGLYWWHPAAWWARRELRETEERACDARVLATWPGTQSQYAAALLTVVGLAQRQQTCVPALANSFGNNGSFKRRIEAMFEPSVPWRMQRFAAVTVLVSGMVLLPISLCSRGAEPSGKAATLAEIREGFTTFERKIVNLSVNTEAKVDNHFRSATGGPVPKGLIQDDAYDLRTNCISSWIVDVSGRIWQTHRAFVEAIREDKRDVHYALEMEAAFDGKRGRGIQTEHRGDRNDVHVHETKRPFTYSIASPLDFSLYFVGTPIRQILQQADARVAGPETWEGRPVVVVEAGLPKPPPGNVEYQQRLWIDPSRGFAAVRKQSFARYSKSGPWHLHLDCALYDCREIAPGVWLPSRVEDKNFAVGPATERNELPLVSHDVIQFHDWKVNSKVPDSKFQISVSIDSDLRPNIILNADSPPAQ